MSEVYVAIGLEESRLEIAIAEVSDIKQTRIMLRSQSLAESVICRQTGTLLSPTPVLTAIVNSLEAFIARGLVQVLMGIPDNLCRMCIARGDESKSGGVNVSETQDSRSEDDRVYSTFQYQASGSAGNELVVTAAREQLLQYAEIFHREPYMLSVITPAAICRYNYLVGQIPGLSNGRYILVHLSDSACDIAVWSEGLPRYHERLPWEGSTAQSNIRWLERVVGVASRSGAVSEILLRGPSEIVAAVERKLVNARRWQEQTAERECEEYSLEGEIHLRSGGCFDISLGLLATEIRRRGVND